ncbi:MAG: hypothetical protein RQ930_04230 [Candidatus Aenigmarchaeota archaeon]|nr:hypothetical protein [Candidatus Aenigmarchaeota archaeon]
MVQELFNALTIINTLLIISIFYLLITKFKVQITETDIARIISLLGSVLQVIKYVVSNPGPDMQKRLQFMEQLLQVIEQEFEKKYKKVSGS